MSKDYLVVPWDKKMAKTSFLHFRISKFNRGDRDL